MMSVFFQKAVGLVTFFILARLLLPNDYGVIAVVMLITRLLSQLTSISFGDALMQRQTDIETYLNPLWTFDLVRTFILAFGVYLAAPWLIDFFHVAEPYAPLVRWGGVFLILPALSNIRQVYLFKELKFKKLFYRDVVGQLAFTIASIGYALFVRADAWALFIGYVVQYAVIVLVSYVIYPAWPRFSASIARLKDLFGFAKWVYGQELLEVMLAQVDKLLVGHMLDTTQLGAYSKARDLASTATNTLSSLMQKIGFVAFSKLQGRLDKIQEGFCKAVDVLFLTGIPVALLLLLEGGAVVNVLLGPKWFLMVVPLKIFAFGNLFYAFVSLVSPVFSALGRPDIVFKMNALRVVLLIPLLYLGIAWGGVNGLAWAIVSVWIATLFYIIWKARPVLLISKRDFYPVIVSGGAACTAVFVMDLLFRAVRSGTESVPTQFFILAFLGILYYVVIGLVSRRRPRGPYATAVSILNQLNFLRR